MENKGYRACIPMTLKSILSLRMSGPASDTTFSTVQKSERIPHACVTNNMGTHILCKHIQFCAVQKEKVVNCSNSF